jgi:hypothetical protein
MTTFVITTQALENYGAHWKEFPAECMSLEEYLDGCDEEYREFKMQYIKRVSPQEVL